MLARYPDRADRHLHLREYPGAEGSLRRQDRARRVRALRQPDARAIAEAKLAALEGAGDCLLFASGMGGDDHRALRHAARARHPRRGHRRQLPAHPAVPEPDAVAATASRCRRCRRATTRRWRTRSGPPPACCVSESPTNPYNRILDLERFAAIGRRAPCEDGDRRHVRDALQPAPAGVGCGRGRALRHQVPGRPQRPPRRCGAGLDASWWGAIRGTAGHHRRDDRSRSRRTSWSAGSRPSRSAWSARTPTRRRWPSFSPRTRGSPRCTTPGLPEPSRARRRPEADAGLRRRGLVRGGGGSRRGRPRGRRVRHPAHRGLAGRRGER